MKASCFSFVSNFRQLSRLKLSIFECGAEQRSDLNNNFWLDFRSARAYVARTRVVYHIHFGPLGLVRLINVSNKFFENILGKWTICKAEKPVIKFGEKGKRKRKTGKIVKSCFRKRKTFALPLKIVNPDFAFSGLCPFINKCSSTIKMYPGFLNFYYQYEKSQKWTHWFNRHNY